MAAFNSINPLNVTKRSSRSQYAGLATNSRRRDIDLEKHEDTEESDDESDYSDYSSSPASSRETSGSYSSNRPMLRRKPPVSVHRPAIYKLPNRIVRYLCLALISTIVIFMLS